MLYQAPRLAIGQAGIAQTGNQTTITQNSTLAIINWQSFSIGANQGVQFVQPGASSIALNRVIGADGADGETTRDGATRLIR